MIVPRERAARWLRFLISGGTGFALYYLFSLGLHASTDWPDGVSAFVATLLAVPPTFVLQRHFTFRAGGDARVQALGYLALQAVCAVVIGLAATGFQRLGLVPALGFFLAGTVGVAVSYLLQSQLIFRQRRVSSSPMNAVYNVAAPDSLPVRLATRQRRVMFRRFIELQAPAPDHSILDVGATSDDTYESSNYLESWYPHKAAITACGIDDASFLEQKYPGMRFVRGDGRSLPFPDRHFDYVHSSAVLEHVGSAVQQADFVRELVRVARRGVFFTTPNRWFPVEFHSVLPLVHWLPKPVFRAILRALGHEALAQEANLNLLTSSEVAALCRGLPRVCEARIELPTLFGWPSNIVCSLKLEPTA